MRNILSSQELDVLRKQRIITNQEIAFRNDSGQLVAENVLTRSQRIVSGQVIETSLENKKLLLDQINHKGNLII